MPTSYTHNHANKLHAQTYVLARSNSFSRAITAPPTAPPGSVTAGLTCDHHEHVASSSKGPQGGLRLNLQGALHTAAAAAAAAKNRTETLLSVMLLFH
jgi:hypothetical protein